jgi:cyclohexanone monooxygenase
VNLKKTPIEYFTKEGIRTSTDDYEFDVIIFATGFDAVTGALDKIDIRGTDGLSLRNKWKDGPRTFLGLTTVGFPNMFISGGPHNAASFCNVPRCLEYNVEWITDCIKYLRKKGYSKLQATPEAESAWTEHVLEGAENTLFTNANSWFMGSNIPGKKRQFLNYIGGIPAFQAHCEKVAFEKYVAFDLK